ncbi:protein ENHANCER OF LHP1 1-like isoform X1 [Castanea sativa]|uniref:protein ENHANCER OF LHP1 1-like isoform X1 n=1 Tax=Castanea sativa TaxID=21020 RepID=UPI003F650BE8
MKVRSVKLREAHKASSSSNGRGGGSFCSVVWDQQAHHLVTASASDPSISIHDPLLPSSAPRILRHHRDGVTAIAISPNSTCLASGSIDHSVKLYKFPGPTNSSMTANAFSGATHQLDLIWRTTTKLKPCLTHLEVVAVASDKHAKAQIY